MVAGLAVDSVRKFHLLPMVLTWDVALDWSAVG